MSCDNETSITEEGITPNRERVMVAEGAFVEADGRVYRVTQVLDLRTIIGLDVESGRSASLSIAQLRPATGRNAEQGEARDLDAIGDEDWRIAEERYAAIQPLLHRWGRHMAGAREEVELRAKELNMSTATLYRWLKRYQTTETVTALIPRKRGWKDGQTRLSGDAESVIQSVIEDYYLTVQRPSLQKTIREVQRRCQAKGLGAPSAGTIRTRLLRLGEKQTLRGRGHREKAKNKFLPAAGHFPNADYPLAVVQIDHTPADIIVVDDVYRRPIGRPWITLAMDIYSRMVTGYYLSFDPPSETSVAMCVAHSILPKNDWLILHKVDADWPVWGIPRTIHVDNGADFRSNNFKRACTAYGINLEFRPVKQPRYGGHIERVLGTLLREIHGLPGTTFSSIKERDGYDAEKQASMTKSELEEWLVTLITKVYHERTHKSLGMSPMRQWEIGIFGEGDQEGVGVPPHPADRHTVFLDFLPTFHRSVQTFGVTIDGLTYYAEALRPWINAKHPETDQKTDFVFRRDPRDISAIWFFDPAIKQYFKIGFADLALPAMSIWEYQQARALLKRQGTDQVKEHEILRAVTELREKVDEAQARTKKARRQAQRRREHEKGVSPAKPLPVPQKPAETLAAPGLIEGDIEFEGEIG